MPAARRICSALTNAMENFSPALAIKCGVAGASERIAPAAEARFRAVKRNQPAEHTAHSNAGPQHIGSRAKGPILCASPVAYHSSRATRTASIALSNARTMPNQKISAVPTMGDMSTVSTSGPIRPAGRKLTDSRSGRGTATSAAFAECARKITASCCAFITSTTTRTICSRQISLRVAGSVTGKCTVGRRKG